MLITPGQIKAARAMLDWSAEDLGKRVGVVKTTISAIETGRSNGSVEVLNAIVSALEIGGIEFQADGGVRPRHTKIVQLWGEEGFAQFMDDVYQCASLPEDPHLSILNVNNEQFVKWHAEKSRHHIARMSKLDIEPARCIVAKDYETDIATEYSNYRWVDQGLLNGSTLYIYGQKVAIINFAETSVEISIVENKQTTSMFRSMFDAIWALSRNDIG